MARLTSDRIAAARTRKLEAMHLQEIEGNHLAYIVAQSKGERVPVAAERATILTFIREQRSSRINSGFGRQLNAARKTLLG
jgi:hypothetical protein